MALVTNIIIVFFIVLGILFDNLAYLIKGIKNKEIARQTLSYSNSLQYVSRIFFMISMTLLAIVFELNIGINNLNLILFVSFSFGLLLSFLLIKKEHQAIAINLLYPLNRIFFNDLSKNVTYSLLDVKGRPILGRYFFLALFVNMCLISAIIFPINFAIAFPDYRMILTYIGQSLSFLSTALYLFLLEPILFKNMDSDLSFFDKRSLLADTIFFSKLSTYSIFTFIFLMLWVF